MKRSAGRPIKPYVTSWNEPIAGLTRCKDGRWRIAATEERLSEQDERRAVERFRAKVAKPAESVRVTVPVEPKLVEGTTWTPPSSGRGSARRSRTRRR